MSNVKVVSWGIVLMALVIFALVLGIRNSSASTVWPTGPWWSSNHPEIVSVNPSTGELHANWKGSAQVCEQKSIKDPTVVQCFSVSLANLGK